MKVAENLRELDPKSIRRNPNNPRRYFNDEQLDLLRTSIQETGILVPLIVFEDPESPGSFVLMDGERRWRSALELGLEAVPGNVIPPPSPLDNLIQMFNIHAVREDWPLVSIALSVDEVMRMTGQTGEKRLSEITGLSRASIRRAKRLLSLPRHELELIQEEAHLDRHEQVHREDLYLEIEAAESVLRNTFPEIASAYERPHIIRQFARKREEDALDAVTDFRAVGRLAKASTEPGADRQKYLQAARALVEDVSLNPKSVFDTVGAVEYEHRALTRRVELLLPALSSLSPGEELPQKMKEVLQRLRATIDRLLGDGE